MSELGMRLHNMDLIKKILLGLLGICIIFTGILALTLIDNSRVDISNYSIYSEKLPKAFDGYKIMLLTDFHNSDNYDEITEKLVESKPDIMVMVGDMVNVKNTSFENLEKLIDKNKDLAPMYFVSGNNEKWSQDEKVVIKLLQNKGVTILNNKSTKLVYQKSAIVLTGFEDVVYSDDAMRPAVVEASLKELSSNKENEGYFNILLCHRANFFDMVSKYPFDLTLSGHLHGGQVNLPFISDYILAQMHIDKKYKKGYYRVGNSQLVVSGGLSKDFKKPRVLNTPELVLVTLKAIN